MKIDQTASDDYCADQKLCKKMGFAVNYLCVLVWLACMISSGVLLFSRGFLLSRVSKLDASRCRHLSENADDEYHISPDIVREIFKDLNASSHLCLPQKSKVIILVIDAMKYEFGVYKPDLIDPLPYENKIPIMHELLLKHPYNTRLLRFRADPPTTTLQRLKGLTTGSLPTFIDIGSNFASPEINEDNIVDQIVNSGLRTVFLGDNTWTDLYPRRFERAYAYPSFDIFDLDTVDIQVKMHIEEEVIRNDWEVLIAHTLGVDHCGHKYGPVHLEMARKLNESNELIRLIVNSMDNQTTLLVMGDHGMTGSGDHGGESEDEVTALLFAYTKQGRFLLSDNESDGELMQQIDLVPTLATILGVPIPYSNLGTINFNIVPDVSVPHLSKLQILLLHIWQNAQQILKYFHNYVLENRHTFTIEELNRIEIESTVLMERVKTITTEDAFKSFADDLQLHLRRILSTCRQIWVKFDATQMSQGLLITFLPIFFSFLLVNNSRPAEIAKIFTSKTILHITLYNLVAGVFGYQYFDRLRFKTAEHGVVFFTNMLSNLVLAFLTVKNWSSIASNWSAMNRFTNIPTRVICVVLMSVFFSNSFVVEEGSIVSYLLIAIIMLLIYDVIQHNVRPDFKTRFRLLHFLKSPAFRLTVASIVAIIFVRVTFVLFRCREEQTNCGEYANEQQIDFSLKRTANGKMYVLAVVITVLYTTLTRLYLRSCGNLTGSSPNVLLARYGPTIASICTGGHILLANSSIKNIQRSHIDAMALVIYALLLLQIAVISLAPLMTHVLPPKHVAIAVDSGESIIPEIFKKIKSIYNGDERDRRYEIPVVYGLATIYSSVCITFGVFLSMVLLVILEARASMGLVMCIAVGAIILYVHSVLRFRTAISFATCVQPTFTAIVGWFLLAHFSFFATSHQTTLSQIDWRAAFVGRSSDIDSQKWVSGLLVVLNTFCGQLFFMCMYSLLSTETFSVFALFPQLIATNGNHESRRADIMDARSGQAGARSHSSISTACVGFDITRGELVLYENESTFLAATFKLAVQFFMLQGMKVFCAMMACTIHCRHLMVWKVFAPRFIYEGLATFVFVAAIAIGYALTIRVHSSVDRLISRINKIK